MQACNALSARHTTLVVGLPGDRRDEDLIATIKTTVPYVDRYILHDLQDQRERQPGEVPLLLRQHLPDEAECHFAANQREAVYKAWAHVQPGDGLIVIADLVDETIAVLRNLTSPLAEDAACTLPLSHAPSLDP